MTKAASLDPQNFLLRLYRAALDAADPMKVVPPHLPARPSGRTVVVGVGKAAAAMARAVQAHWQGSLSGVVVVPPGAGLPLQYIRVIEGSHPIPNENSVVGAKALLQAVTGLSKDDLVIALVSGGGSAVCALPAEGLSLVDKQSITQKLLRRGATIAEINTVRRHLSAIKGGRLAARAYPARVVTLLISDIPGDHASLIASGPTLADNTSCADALAVLKRYDISHLPSVLQALSQSQWESVKEGDMRLSRNSHHIIATAWNGMQAASLQATKEGVASHILSDAMQGEARDMAQAHAAIALSVAQRNVPFTAPCVLLCGGEATVTVRGQGRGGRNTEFVLALALALQAQFGSERIHAISAGTDGQDGSALAAGAWMGPQTIAHASAQGLSPLQSLDTNDSATFLEAAGTLVHTGPTLTNINDFRAIFIC